MKVSRRQFLKTSAVIGATASFPGLAAMAREPYFQFPTKAVDRLALTSWPFRAYMDGPKNTYRDPSKPGMDLVQFARMAIEKFNIHNINPISIHFQSTEPHGLEKLRKTVEQAGSRFVGLGLGAGQFYDPDPAVRKASVERCKRWIDAAVILGSPSVRPALRGREGVEPNVDFAAESLGNLADYGARKNIVVNMENDNFMYENPFLIVKIIEKAKNPYLRALPDMGNTLGNNGDPEYNRRALKALYRHAFNMSHVKDVIRSDFGKSIYKVDLAKTFGIAKAAGYKGYFSMECFNLNKGDPFAGTHRLVQETLHYLS